jgi:hypothetical protein
MVDIGSKRKNYLFVYKYKLTIWNCAADSAFQWYTQFLHWMQFWFWGLAVIHYFSECAHLWPVIGLSWVSRSIYCNLINIDISSHFIFSVKCLLLFKCFSLMYLLFLDSTLIYPFIRVSSSLKVSDNFPSVGHPSLLYYFHVGMLDLLPVTFHCLESVW